ncbi:Tctex1 domain-containing protein 2 [Coemansia interrupta]|uniref:Tctex1 domain-containing protein 2 n=1 Tax=Coemansia interrupta TaxID=1126814 RepID=A0A9W8LPC9_9FUNG|nr:Tctex1 domain-containing protein 2 [Coemansia interrupta]
MAATGSARHSSNSGGGAMPQPDYMHKFRPATARPLIGEILRGEIGGWRYDAAEVAEVGKRVSEAITKRLSSEAGMERYKFITNVSLFQNDGQGARMGTSMVWDAESDAAVQETYASEGVRCVAVVFAVYVY